MIWFGSHITEVYRILVVLIEHIYSFLDSVQRRITTRRPATYYLIWDMPGVPVATGPEISAFGPEKS